jgi:hypothetical protein
MNMYERIKELMDEAIRFRLDPDSKNYEAQVSPEDLEVFAESLVREFAYDCFVITGGNERIEMVAKKWGVEL